MNRLRLVLASLGAALAITLLSAVVPGTYIIDCERDDPAPCRQAAGGFPLLYMVDNHGISPVGRVDLLGALIGEDILIARNFWADVMIWWIAALTGWTALRRPLQPARTNAG